MAETPPERHSEPPVEDITNGTWDKNGEKKKDRWTPPALVSLNVYDINPVDCKVHPRNSYCPLRTKHWARRLFRSREFPYSEHLVLLVLSLPRNSTSRKPMMSAAWSESGRSIPGWRFTVSNGRSALPAQDQPYSRAPRDGVAPTSTSLGRVSR
jgi:hypothetical protein